MVFVCFKELGDYGFKYLNMLFSVLFPVR
uniref:Uncharacterized protein n=1 Tax=Nelumbo nucifera TaxID=4432 RepID=A0A823A1B5_NELNU|nr:TPA_asm: hypothetical protein HUJ06_017896 [Nelumbo nucifera]DAD47965.1 TPA_asm: hypothetical protein HUJ06_017902 [Nelumbo nucifera]